MLDANDNSPAEEPPKDAPWPEKRGEERPTTGEAPFDLDEVFFSRTDERGVILTGNYVFKRVANYDWPQLIGAPHKLIRHPDMPKAVFWLLWDTIKKGRPIGAYVKNKARDGLHYWVFASVVPTDGGYLSARIKPSSPILDIVQQQYADLLAYEAGEGVTPEDSAKVLMERLAGLGFANYIEFEAHALSTELRARSDTLGLPADPAVTRFQEMLTLAKELKKTTETLVREFEAVQIIPHNMRVMASRLEPTGGPFNTLSSNYGAMSSEMSDWFASNVVGEGSNFANISESVNRSMFNAGINLILRECDTQLHIEQRRLGEIDIPAERRILNNVVRRYGMELEKSRAVIVDEASRIGIACKTMARHVLGLSTTRVMCKIESARMAEAGEGIDDIIGQLGRFQDKIGNQLKTIEKLGEDIQSMAAKRDEVQSAAE